MLTEPKNDRRSHKLQGCYENRRPAVTISVGSETLTEQVRAAGFREPNVRVVLTCPSAEAGRA